MSEHPLVSVVIATYNMANYLPLAVRSALDQRYPNIEVIVVDDGSQDNTSEVVAPFLQNPRVKYLVQKKKGQAAAKNWGVRKSQGDYVAFLDADDIWMPEKLEMQMPLFERNRSTGVVHSRLSYIDEQGQDLGVAENELFRGRVCGQLLIENFVGFGTTIVRRECFERLGYFKEHLQMGIDYDLWLRFSTQFEFDFVDRPLLQYRIWPGQISKNCQGRYASGIEIMQAFLAEFPGLVDQETQDVAWAHTYVGFGQCMQQNGGQRNAAFRYYLQALHYRLSYFPAWKAIVLAVLGFPL